MSSMVGDSDRFFAGAGRAPYPASRGLAGDWSDYRARVGSKSIWTYSTGSVKSSVG